MRNYFKGIFTALVLMLVLGCVTLFGTQKSINNQQEISITPSAPNNISTAPAPSPTSQAEPEVNVSEQIIAVMTSKNTQALEGYMADTVQVRLESSGCCGPLTKAEAVSQLSYLDPAVGWNFDPASQILIDLAGAVPDYYGSGWIVGVASNEYLVSFKLNDQDKIDAYNLAATYKLLIP